MAEGRTRRFLITGLAALLPTLLTVYLLYVIVIWVHAHIGSKFNELFGIQEQSWQIFLGDAIALVLLLGLLWLAGFLVATYFGRMLFRRLDKGFRRVPLIRVVYPAVKQVTDFFLTKPIIPLSRVVAVEYPRRGIYSVGFNTGGSLRQITTDEGRRLVSIFIPNTPAPLTGFTIFVPADEVIQLDLSVDEAIKLVVSGGVVVPDRERRSALEAPPGRSAPEDLPSEQPNQEG